MRSEIEWAAPVCYAAGAAMAMSFPAAKMSARAQSPGEETPSSLVRRSLMEWSTSTLVALSFQLDCALLDGQILRVQMDVPPKEPVSVLLGESVISQTARHAANTFIVPLCALRVLGEPEKVDKCIQSLERDEPLSLRVGSDLLPISITKKERVFQHVSFTQNGSLIKATATLAEDGLLQPPLDTDGFICTASCTNGTYTAAFALERLEANGSTLEAVFGCSGFSSRLSGYVKPAALEDEAKLKALKTLGGKLERVCNDAAQNGMRACRFSLQRKGNEVGLSSAEVALGLEGAKDEL